MQYNHAFKQTIKISLRLLKNEVLKIVIKAAIKLIIRKPSKLNASVIDNRIAKKPLMNMATLGLSKLESKMAANGTNKG